MKVIRRIIKVRKVGRIIVHTRKLFPFMFVHVLIFFLSYLSIFMKNFKIQTLHKFWIQIRIHQFTMRTSFLYVQTSDGYNYNNILRITIVFFLTYEIHHHISTPDFFMFHLCFVPIIKRFVHFDQLSCNIFTWFEIWFRPTITIPNFTVDLIWITLVTIQFYEIYNSW